MPGNPLVNLLVQRLLKSGVGRGVKQGVKTMVSLEKADEVMPTMARRFGEILSGRIKKVGPTSAAKKRSLIEEGTEVVQTVKQMVHENKWTITGRTLRFRNRKGKKFTIEIADLVPFRSLVSEASEILGQHGGKMSRRHFFRLLKRDAQRLSGRVHRLARIRDEIYPKGATQYHFEAGNPNGKYLPMTIEERTSRTKWDLMERVGIERSKVAWEASKPWRKTYNKTMKKLGGWGVDLDRIEEIAKRMGITKLEASRIDMRRYIRRMYLANKAAVKKHGKHIRQIDPNDEIAKLAKKNGYEGSDLMGDGTEHFVDPMVGPQQVWDPRHPLYDGPPEWL